MQKGIVLAKCGSCGKTKEIGSTSYKHNVAKNKVYRCLSCANSQSNRPRPKIKPHEIVEAICSICGNPNKIQRASMDRNAKSNGRYICQSCTSSQSWKPNQHNISKLIEWSKSDRGRRYHRESSKQMWIDNRDKLVEGIKRGCQNPETIKKKRESSRLHNRPELLAKFRQLWQTKEYRDKVSVGTKRVWSNPKYKEKMAAVRGSSNSHVSSIQEILYSILDDLGIKYYREHEGGPSDPQCTIGPYNFDCVIPREGKSDLLIECQGDYWHNLPEKAAIDASKASYIVNNFSDKYELKCLWEHEFYTKDKVKSLVEYWVGLTKANLRDFDFRDVEIKICPAKDYKLLLSKYHYLPNAGRGGIAYGAYLGVELIGVCVFSPAVRQNVAKSLDVANGEIRELSRFCINPMFQKRNFASWFISRCINKLPEKFSCIISYCDTTFGHNGSIYKAANFKSDKEIKPDYYYAKSDGWAMHKKTLYNRAKVLQMTEKGFADKNGYFKRWTNKKIRYVYRRDNK